MSYQARINAVLLSTGLPRLVKTGFEIPQTDEAGLAPAPEPMAPPPAPPATPEQASAQLSEIQQDVAGVRQDLARILDQAGVPSMGADPSSELPAANPEILDSVLQRARLVRDPADYLRLLSHDPNVNEMARSAALPTMLMSDAVLGRSLSDSRTRESILDALRNLQSPSPTEARPAATMPMGQSAYPLWYPRGRSIF